ncbi:MULTISPECIES: hypothetical protein [Streptomyces]|nr:hypothetical protein [Streptomyces spororaveus]
MAILISTLAFAATVRADIDWPVPTPSVAPALAAGTTSDVIDWP